MPAADPTPQLQTEPGAAQPRTAGPAAPRAAAAPGTAPPRAPPAPSLPGDASACSARPARGERSGSGACAAPARPEQGPALLPELAPARHRSLWAPPSSPSAPHRSSVRRREQSLPPAIFLQSAARGGGRSVGRGSVSCRRPRGRKGRRPGRLPTQGTERLLKQ